MSRGSHRRQNEAEVSPRERLISAVKDCISRELLNSLLCALTAEWAAMKARRARLPAQSAGRSSAGRSGSSRRTAGVYDLVTGESSFIQRITRRAHPVTYWLIVSTWIVLSVLWIAYPGIETH